MKKDFVYLASASPRRRELLEQIGVRFRLLAAEVDERAAAGEAPRAYVKRMASAKADAAWAVVAGRPERAPVLAADTAVILDGQLYGKPESEAAALDMLTALSGKRHVVMTCVALRYEDLSEVVLAESEVRFRATTAAERRAYCATSEPLDKAGGYGIQGLGAVFVEQLRGSYSAVMGLPLFETAALLKRFGLPAWLEDGHAQ